MARFTQGIPVTTSVPVVAVDPGLAPGRYRFRLEVVDSGGNRSRPAEVIVVVRRTTLPPITHLDVPRGRRRPK